MKTILTLAASVATVALLTACGGGGSDGAVEAVPLDTQVPTTASASADAFMAYAQGQIALDATRPRDEPIGMGDMETPPASETSEPVTLD